MTKKKKKKQTPTSSEVRPVRDVLPNTTSFLNDKPLVLSGRQTSQNIVDLRSNFPFRLLKSALNINCNNLRVVFKGTGVDFTKR